MRTSPITHPIRSRNLVGRLTQILGSVLEGHRVARLAVGRASQLHEHGDRLPDVLEPVRRRLVGDGNLTMHVVLAELAAPLPRHAIGCLLVETHLDII